MTLSNYNYNLFNGETFSYLKNGKKVQVGDTSETRGAGVGKVQDLKFEQIIEQFTTGNMVLSEAVKGLRAKGATISMSQNNGKLAVIGFRFQGKMYTISCNSKDAASQVDERAHSTFTANELKGLDAEIIKKYFQTTVMENGKVTKYAFKEDCGYTSLSQLKQDLYQQYQNDLILDNFLAGRGMAGSSATKLTYTASGKAVTSSNFLQYADEIKLATGEEAKQLRREAFNKFIKEFASGNVSSLQSLKILNAIGVESKTKKTVNGNYEYTIKFEGKTYKVICNKDAAAKADDDKTVQTLDKKALTQLAKDVKTNLDSIMDYFEPVAQEGGNATLFKLKENVMSKYKTVEELKDALTPKPAPRDPLMQSVAVNEDSSDNEENSSETGPIVVGSTTLESMLNAQQNIQNVLNAQRENLQKLDIPKAPNVTPSILPNVFVNTTGYITLDDLKEKHGLSNANLKELEAQGIIVTVDSITPGAQAMYRIVNQPAFDNYVDKVNTNPNSSTLGTYQKDGKIYYKASDLSGIDSEVKPYLFKVDKDSATGEIKGYALKEPYTSLELITVGNEQVYFLKGKMPDGETEQWTLAKGNKRFTYTTKNQKDWETFIDTYLKSISVGQSSPNSPSKTEYTNPSSWETYKKNSITYYKASDLAGLTVGLKNRLFVPDIDITTGEVKGYTLKEPYTSIELVTVGDEQVYFLKGKTQDDEYEQWMLANDNMDCTTTTIKEVSKEKNWEIFIDSYLKYISEEQSSPNSPSETKYTNPCLTIFCKLK